MSQLGGEQTIEAGAARPLFSPDRLEVALAEDELDAVVAHSRHNHQYLSGLASLEYVFTPTWASFVVIPTESIEAAAVIIPLSEQLTAQARGSWIERKIYCGSYYVKDAPAAEIERAPSAWDGLTRAIGEHGLEAGRVGFELELLPVEVHERLRSAFPRMELVNASPLLRRLRMVKTEEERRRIRVACTLTEEAIGDGIAVASPGVTEVEVAQAVAGGIVARGADVLYVQVATGAAAGTGLPTERPLQSGDIVRFDVAATYRGYNSDLSRTIAVRTATDRDHQLYRTAYQAMRAGISAVAAGAAAAAVYQAAMATWAEAGYPEVRRHHVGHGIGLQTHEHPVLRADGTDTIEAAMVLAVEVPCYVYGVGGFAPEDIVSVETAGIEEYSHAPAELPVLT